MKTMNSTQKIVVKRSLSLLFVGAIASSALFASSAQAATSSNSQRTISLTTTATLNVVPDTIAFTFTLTDTEKNNDTAYSTVSGLGNKITALLKEQGIASVNITSSTVSLSPIYDYSNNTQTLTGYQANQNFKVVLRNMKTAPTIMTKVIDLGGNAIIVNSTNTYVYNSSTNDAKLRARVVAKARATATSYAHLLGDKLKNLVSLSENPIDNNPMPIYLAKASSTSGDTTAPSINVGIQTLSVTISTVWAIV
jgi:uncharacterized protein YggE